jgi:hypothetical protein
MKRLILFILVVLPVVLAAAWVSANGGRPLSTDLTGEAEVNAAGEPNQGDLDGSGSAHITLNQGQGEVCFELHVADIVLPAAAAHIHAAPAGVNGPVVVHFTAPDADGFSSGCATGVDADLIKDIRQNPSAYYVNVHTSDFPGGAVRGQLSK